MSILIETDQLVKHFGDIKAVDGISIKVSKGEVLGFLGPNGAGKSTTMKLITGFLEPDSGVAKVCGINVNEYPEKAKAKLGYLPEGAPLYGDMTPRTFLKFIGEIHGFDGAERDKRVEEIVEKTGLEAVFDQTIETLSKGYKRRVGLAQAMIHNPNVLILDEPTDGLDPNQKHHVRDMIREMAKDKAIIVSTHILEEVEAVCSRAIVIDKGRVVADGTAEELQSRMDYHNAVSIRVSQATADKVRSELEVLAGIERIETMARSNGAVQIRAVPKAGEPIAADVVAILKDRSIGVEELFVERGRLEDVFRQITTADTETGDA